jgi:hypothetical protein
MLDRMMCIRILRVIYPGINPAMRVIYAETITLAQQLIYPRIDEL